MTGLNQFPKPFDLGSSIANLTAYLRCGENSIVHIVYTWHIEHMNKETSSIRVINEEKYKGEWLALNPETREVIAHGTVLKDVAEEAKTKGYEEPVFHGVPQSDIHFITVE